MRLPNPYSLEETLGKLRHRLATACNEDAQVLLEKAVAKASDDEDTTKSILTQYIDNLLQSYQTDKSTTDLAGSLLSVQA